MSCEAALRFHKRRARVPGQRHEGAMQTTVLFLRVFVFSRHVSHSCWPARKGGLSSP
jgi:hypothetical protein